MANSLCLTGLTEADCPERILEAYQAVDLESKLNLHVAADITTPFGKREVPLDYKLLESMRDKYKSPHVDTRFVKIYLDGVPLADSRSGELFCYST